MDPAEQDLDHPADPWRGQVGNNWLQAHHITDAAFEPIKALLVDKTKQHGAINVLDIGCGTGATTLAIAKHLRESGKATGIDVSQPMIDFGRSTAQKSRLNTEYICADAETYDFQQNTYDLLVSRFGVMFFEDPVAAFGNLKNAATHGAKGIFVAWRSPEENPFMTTAGKAAKGIVTLPEFDPDAPGQFAFAKKNRVEGILKQSGWKNITIIPIDFECAFPCRELVAYFTRLGPIGRIFDTLDEQTKIQLTKALLHEFEPFVVGDWVKFTAACWEIEAESV